MKIKQKILSTLLLTALSSTTIAQKHKAIEINVNNLNGVTTKTVTVDGRQLNDEEIAAMQANGELKSFDINDKEFVMSSQEMDNLENDGKLTTIQVSKDGTKKVIVMSSNDDKNVNLNAFGTDGHATLGFMNIMKDDGWHVFSVIKDSGAEVAGLQAGDVIKSINGFDLTQNKDESIKKYLQTMEFEEGEIVNLVIQRDGQSKILQVEASQNNPADIMMNVSSGFFESDDNAWTSELSDLSELGNISVMVMKDGEQFQLNQDDIHINFPDDFKQMNMFVTDGNSTAKLLGKKHKLSTLNAGLADYFGTQGGVLVLNVEDDNVFGLQNGDVIKSINGKDVNKPIDVVLQLLKEEKLNAIGMNIVRHKQNKTLKYKK